VFPIIWGICFSLKADLNALKTWNFGTVVAQATRLLFIPGPKADGIDLTIIQLVPNDSLNPTSTTGSSEDPRRRPRITDAGQIGSAVVEIACEPLFEASPS
jgi:hypothetical protein